MEWLKAIRALRYRVNGMVRIAKLYGFAGDDGSFQAASAAEDLDDACQLMQAHGFFATPPDGARGLVLNVGGSRAGRTGVAFSAGHPGGLADGDTVVYNEQGSVIVLRANGAIEITPTSGQTVTIGVAPGALPVARMTDPVIADATMTTWIAGVQAICSSPAITALAALSPPVPPVDFGLVSEGSSTVLSS